MENQPENIHGKGVIQQEETSELRNGKGTGIRGSCAVRVSAEGNIKLSRSIAGAVIAENDVDAIQSSIQAAVAGADINFYNSRIKIAIVGNHLKLQKSHASIIKAGGDADLAGSSVNLLAGSRVTAHKSRIGVVLSRQTNLGEGTQVLVTTAQAVAFGSAFGAVFGIIHWLLKRE
jgi:hypothetical protein